MIPGAVLGHEVFTFQSTSLLAAFLDNHEHGRRQKAEAQELWKEEEKKDVLS